MGRKNSGKGKKGNPTDFSHLLIKADEMIKIEVEDVKIKED